MTYWIFVIRESKKICSSGDLLTPSGMLTLKWLPLATTRGVVFSSLHDRNKRKLRFLVYTPGGKCQYLLFYGKYSTNVEKETDIAIVSMNNPVSHMLVTCVQIHGDLAKILNTINH